MTARVTIADASGVGAARRAAAALARASGLDEERSGQVQLAAAELASNLHRHAGGGEILMRRLVESEGEGVDVVAVDRGPGIPNVADALRDGFSTAGGPGTGLGAVRRLARVFDLHSVPGSGTAVLARVGPGPEGGAGGLEVGAVCLAMEGEQTSGDGWALQPVRQGLRIMVADGLGHGPAAREASGRAAAMFGRTADLALDDQLRRIHEALRQTRGAAVALAELDLAARAVRHTGVGNIGATVMSSAARKGLVSVPGTAGHAMRSVLVVQHDYPPGAVLLMHSDGCRAGWSLDGQPGAQRRHPALLAALVWRDWARPRDDATVVAVRELDPAA